MRAHTEGKDKMGKRSATVIGVAAAGVMALGASAPNVAASSTINNNGAGTTNNISVADQVPRQSQLKDTSAPKIATTVLKTKHDTANNSIGNVK